MVREGEATKMFCTVAKSSCFSWLRTPLALLVQLRPYLFAVSADVGLCKVGLSSLLPNALAFV